MAPKMGIVARIYFEAEDYKNGLRAMRDDGYEAVDFGNEFALTSCVLYTYGEKKLREFLKDTAKCAADEGVEIAQIHGLMNANGTTEQGRAENIEYCLKQINAARILGCKNIVQHPVMPFGRNAGDDDYALDLNVRTFEFLSKVAGDNGVNICVENMPMSFMPFATVHGVRKIVTAVNNPHCKACLDTGHAHSCHENVAESAELFGNDLAALHVHDNTGVGDPHLPPYKGNIDWDAFTGKLREIGYTGDFSLEVNMPEGLTKEEFERERKEMARSVRKMLDKTFGQKA